MPFIILPNQLYEISFLKDYKQEKFLIVEEEIYFGYREKKRLNFNKIKLAYHRASMRYYYSYLKENDFDVEYIEFKEARKQSYLKKEKGKVITLFDPVDHLLEKKLKTKAKTLKKELVFIDTPNFLVSKDRLTSAKPMRFHSSFYNFMKKELSINGLKSYDTENRKKIPSTEKIPELKGFETESRRDSVVEAINYVKKTFPKNTYGDFNSLYLYPITHIDAKKRLKTFMKEKLSKFGDYQDAMRRSQPFLFHSVISPCLNIGLITPYDVLEELEKYRSLKSIKMNNYEGFLRQIIGWREFQRYTYMFFYKEMKGSNYFGHTKKLTADFYKGTTGIDPVDDCIKMGFKYGYLHHILRLMVMSNFMNLSEISPNECYKWFMEFSVDSYDWVMIQNVYSMGQWSDGGLTMRRPYISGSNYIRKMSDYGITRNDNWQTEWDFLYHRFIKKNRQKLKGTFFMPIFVKKKKK